jgi:hypothetical protein
MSFYQIGRWFAEAIGDVRATSIYRNSLDFPSFYNFMEGFTQYENASVD